MLQHLVKNWFATSAATITPLIQLPSHCLCVLLFTYKGFGIVFSPYTMHPSNGMYLDKAKIWG